MSMECLMASAWMPMTIYGLPSGAVLRFVALMEKMANSSKKLLCQRDGLPLVLLLVQILINLLSLARAMMIQRGAYDESIESFRQVSYHDYLQRHPQKPFGDAVGVIVAAGVENVPLGAELPAKPRIQALPPSPIVTAERVAVVVAPLLLLLRVEETRVRQRLDSRVGRGVEQRADVDVGQVLPLQHFHRRLELADLRLPVGRAGRRRPGRGG